MATANSDSINKIRCEFFQSDCSGRFESPNTLGSRKQFDRRQQFTNLAMGQIRLRNSVHNFSQMLKETEELLQSIDGRLMKMEASSTIASHSRFGGLASESNLGYFFHGELRYGTSQLQVLETPNSTSSTLAIHEVGQDQGIMTSIKQVQSSKFSSGMRDELLAMDSCGNQMQQQGLPTLNSSKFQHYGSYSSCSLPPSDLNSKCLRKFQNQDGRQAAAKLWYIDVLENHRQHIGVELIFALLSKFVSVKCEFNEADPFCFLSPTFEEGMINTENEKLDLNDYGVFKLGSGMPLYSSLLNSCDEDYALTIELLAENSELNAINTCAKLLVERRIVVQFRIGHLCSKNEDEWYSSMNLFIQLHVDQIMLLVTKGKLDDMDKSLKHTMNSVIISIPPKPPWLPKDFEIFLSITHGNTAANFLECSLHRRCQILYIVQSIWDICHVWRISPYDSKNGKTYSEQLWLQKQYFSSNNDVSMRPEAFHWLHTRWYNKLLFIWDPGGTDWRILVVGALWLRWSYFKSVGNSTSMWSKAYFYHWLLAFLIETMFVLGVWVFLLCLVISYSWV